MKSLILLKVMKTERIRMMKNKLKKIISAAGAVIISLTAMPLFSVHADDLEQPEDLLTDGTFNYELVDGTYTITKCVATIVTKVPAVQNGIPITAIGDYAFLNCTGISELTIPDSVRSIGEGAFADCRSMESIKLPKNIDYFGPAVFSGCGALESVTIPDTITEIPDYTFFKCYKLTDVKLPEKTTKIGAYSFYQCSSLAELKLPASLTTIDEMALGEMFSIQNIDASACPDFTFDEGMLMDKDKSTIYRASVDFEGDVYIPESVTTIASGAFSTCGGITNLFIPPSVTTIGADAFTYCTNIKSIDFSEGLTTIGDNAFLFDSGIESLSLPTTLTSIGNNAFSYCEGLNKVVLSEGLKKIGTDAFLGCDSLTKIIIPKSVETIGDGALGYIVENQQRTPNKKFSMSVYSGSAAEKYAKSNKLEYTVTDKSLKRVVFIIVAVGIIIAAIVFAVVLMARGRKGASMSAKKAQKLAKEKAEEDNYKTIIDDSDNTPETDNDKKSDLDK